MNYCRSVSVAPARSQDEPGDPRSCRTPRGDTPRRATLVSIAGAAGESASFRYDERWLTHPERFALEPALILGPGPHHTPTGRALFGALGDSAPDRWGRALMARAERRVARAEKRPPTSLTELDYLLRVNDFARQGALRFSAEPDGPFLSETSEDPVPPLIELPRLLAAADRLDTDDEEALALLPGTRLVTGWRPSQGLRTRRPTADSQSQNSPSRMTHSTWSAGKRSR